MANNVPAAIPKSSVAATHPNKNGIAPGIAPTNIEMVESLFNGVQDNTYNNIEINPKKEDFDQHINLKQISHLKEIEQILNEY